MITEAATIESLANYIESMEIAPLFGHKVLFRGQPVKGNLLPSIARNDRTKDTTSIEKDSLEQMRLIGSNLLSSKDEDDWHAIVKAQHHGLKTRCLDWTSNPMVALWFACSNSPDVDSYVYMLVADGAAPPDRTKSPFEQEHTCILQPSYESPRVSAQHGWLTVHNYKNGQFTPLEDSQDEQLWVCEYLIPKEIKSELINSLNRCGINQSTIFPDLDGLCGHLNQKFT
ncbi:FRG domain-containing protein [Vibrio parahaemolyticus]|uniref:FRG domain-containing protein n=1 Tax=Vibrio parahaemolyticus TaxID=670 RepID=UPI0005F0C85A|nr:FRG domain-containing protein [Vibrio parahaemolyticus]EKZ9180839.1 FRG domain-containing protein [Vibrio vulnificus]EGQ8047572.1 FRG domain-containing protein [Vibrio parahaemolyticus]EHH2867057.1 FRG domain-containing protein [Vibrio parahaemolyticus]ELA9316628.1 FRG domain-containing protein [Vibrio parahaemolyticus]ELI5395508.1 FRG domain-containing protein [Vibrio parahaemolyticus]